MFFESSFRKERKRIFIYLSFRQLDSSRLLDVSSLFPELLLISLTKVITLKCCIISCRSMVLCCIIWILAQWQSKSALEKKTNRRIFICLFVNWIVQACSPFWYFFESSLSELTKCGMLSWYLDFGWLFLEILFCFKSSYDDLFIRVRSCATIVSSNLLLIGESSPANDLYSSPQYATAFANTLIATYLRAGFCNAWAILSWTVDKTFLESWGSANWMDSPSILNAVLVNTNDFAMNWMVFRFFSQWLWRATEAAPTTVGTVHSVHCIKYFAKASFSSCDSRIAAIASNWFDESSCWKFHHFDPLSDATHPRPHRRSVRFLQQVEANWMVKTKAALRMKQIQEFFRRDIGCFVLTKSKERKVFGFTRRNKKDYPSLRKTKGKFVFSMAASWGNLNSLGFFNEVNELISLEVNVTLEFNGRRSLAATSQWRSPSRIGRLDD